MCRKDLRLNDDDDDEDDAIFVGGDESVLFDFCFGSFGVESFDSFDQEKKPPDDDFFGGGGGSGTEGGSGEDKSEI